MNPATTPPNGAFISLSEAAVKRQRYIDALGNPDNPTPNPNPALLGLFQYRMMRVNANLVQQLLKFEKNGQPVTNIRIYPGINLEQENGNETQKLTIILCAESADGSLVTAEDLSEMQRTELQLTVDDDVIDEIRPCPPPGCPDDIV